jgi:hypothetical protein
MGRSGSSAKRVPGPAANQHNSKHENGVVGPGKRIQRQKSNRCLNGNAQSIERAPPLPTPSATPPPLNGHARNVADAVSDAKLPSSSLRRSSLTEYSETSSSESFHNASNMSVLQENHRRIDVNAAKNPNVHRDAGPLNFLVTVLRSCPLYDTIAILIVLLQLPPTFLSVVHLLFATLTFVPPSTSSHSNFTFTDIFEGALGTPSVATLVAVDVLVLLIWLFLWAPLQHLSLDLAQTVIALTLGGGTTGKDAGANNVLISLGIIGVSHFTRHGGFKKSNLFSSSRSDLDDPLESQPTSSNKGTHGWIRTILAIHILTQGVVRYIRDWYVRRERRDLLVSALGDPEAAKGSISSCDGSLQEPGSNTSNTEADSITNSSDKSLNPKKKKRASAQVRIRQPLWAALASTKIVMAKEYETSRTAAESAGTNATDINNLGNAPFDTEADRIWITYIGCDEVCFNTSYFSHTPPPVAQDDAVDNAGVDHSKPFFVRVNQTVWQPTRINAIQDANSSPKNEMRWSGEIFGLAPMSSYECEFISPVDGSIIFSTNVRTMQAPTTDMTFAPVMVSNAQRSSRPDSPTTTLKTSIATAEAKLNEERNRQKRERKDQKTKMNSARKEIDKLTSTISSSGGNDDRLRQKVQQSNLHAKQAEDAVASLAERLKLLENLPEDEITAWKCAKLAWQAQKDVHKASRSDFHEAKVAAERELQALAAEVTAFQQKRERMQSRINKLNGEYDRITDANARGLDEAQRKESERAAKQADRARTEMMYMERLDTLGPQIHEMQQTLASLWATIHAMQQAEFMASQAHSQPSPTTTVPTNSWDLPENSVVNTSYPWNPPTYATSYPSLPMAYHTPPGHRTRGRSSSMLSNVSGFTQSSSEELPIPRDIQAIIDGDRQKSDGSSSTSRTSGSVSDPKSPISRTASGAGNVKYNGPWEENS